MSEEEFDDIINDPVKYKNWIIEILELSDSDLAKNIKTKLEHDEIDSELDILLRQLSNITPYDMLVPTLRHNLGFSIRSDEECTAVLKSIKLYLSNDQQVIINYIINYVNSDEGELPDDIVPEIDLLMMLESLPIEIYPEIYNCVDYIVEISE